VRATKFARYLPDYNWKPYVLTVDTSDVSNADISRLKEIEGIPITRTNTWPTVLDILVTLKKKLGFNQTKESHHTSTFKVAQTSDSLPLQTTRPAILRILDSIFESPDRHIGWFFPALIAGYKIIKKENIDVILTSSPPPTTGLIGLALSLLTGKKLITDLRDPLILHERKSPDRRTFLSDKMESCFENALYKRSYRVVSATARHSNHLKEQFQLLPSEKFVTIWNGYDSSDFAHIQKHEKNIEQFTISYLGSFYNARSPKTFLQALSSLIKEKAIPRDKISINFIGDVFSTEGKPTQEIVSENQLENCVTLIKRMPYKQALEMMSKADALLLIAPDSMNYYAVPAKTFEYLHVNTNILCLTGDSATAELLMKLKCGTLANPYEIDDIKKGILTMYNNWVKSDSQHETQSVDISEYERKRQTEILSTLISD